MRVDFVLHCYFQANKFPTNFQFLAIMGYWEGHYQLRVHSLTWLECNNSLLLHRVISATKVKPRSQHPQSPDREFTHLLGIQSNSRPSGGLPENITLSEHTNAALPHPAKTIMVIAMYTRQAATPSEPRSHRKSVNKTSAKMRLKPRNRNGLHQH